MQFDQTLFFRKPITPWYDSNAACWILIVFCSIVFFFALAGIVIAFANPAFKDHVWFPYMLAFLNLFLILKVLFRMKKRNKYS